MPTTHRPLKSSSALRWVSSSFFFFYWNFSCPYSFALTEMPHIILIVEHSGSIASTGHKWKKERLLLEKLTDLFISPPCECIGGMLTMLENTRWSCELQAAQGTEKQSIFFGVWNINAHVILYTLTVYAHAPANTYPCTHKEESLAVWVFK